MIIMKCKNCDKIVKNTWKFCPYCGSEIKRKIKILPSFNNFFKVIDDEFKRFDRLFKRSPKTRIQKLKPKTGGITIRIHGNPGEEPKIKVNKFRENFHKAHQQKRPKKIQNPQKNKPPRKVKEMIEPSGTLKRIGKELLVEVNVPDVNSIKDVQVNKMPESIEIKAYAKDKAYFKVFGIPSESTIMNKTLDSGVLKIKLTET